MTTLPVVPLGPRTVDDPVYVEPLRFAGLAFAVRHVDSVDIFQVFCDPALMRLDPTGHRFRRKQGADLRRDAMTMHIPVRPQVTKKSLLVRTRKRAPNVLRERTKRVDH